MILDQIITRMQLSVWAIDSLFIIHYLKVTPVITYLKRGSS